jgi:diphosphomevalonate decarboxylase
MHLATAHAHPNIAFIKYWGNCEAEARIPANGSISMNLAGLYSRTSVEFDPALSADELVLQDKPGSGDALARVSTFLDIVRGLSGTHTYTHVESENNFPMGTGIASSASAFAALAVAASSAAGLNLTEKQLSQLARQGSGSACRSIPSGFVEWQISECDADSAAVSIAPPEHWPLVDHIAIVNQEHKLVGSTAGHDLAHTSILQNARVADAPRRLEICRRAILQRDFESLAEIIELDCNLMHAVMMTSTPRLLYWEPNTLAVIEQVIAWRAEGLLAAYTIDAGPNVHVICEAPHQALVKERLGGISGVAQVITAHPGGRAELLSEMPPN